MVKTALPAGPLLAGRGSCSRPARRGNRYITKTLMVMKLIMILLTAAFLNVSAHGIAQSVSYSGKNVPLDKVLTAVEKQTGYVFLYTDPVLAAAKPVSISVKNLPLEKFLSVIFSTQPLEYTMNGKSIFINPKQETRQPATQVSSGRQPFAGDSLIIVRVTDSSGIPLAGASATIMKRNLSTVSNSWGIFSLPVNEGDELLVSFVGYETRRLIVSNTLISVGREIAIVLRPAIASLKEVEVLINTGYEQLPKERATGSFEFISKEELNRRPGFDLLSRLEGITTSIRFDRRFQSASDKSTALGNITIRGISTLTGTPATVMQPLIIVNNFPYEGDLNNINPNDVESITILKDAGATSIYGARAANGVIVINTKQAQGQKTRFSLNTNVQVTRIPDLFKLPRMSAAEFIDMETFLFDQGFYNADLNNKRYPALSPAIEILAKRRANQISVADSAAAIDALKALDVRNEFENQVYQQDVSQQYFLNASGGSDKAKYSLGIGFDKDQTLLKGNNNKRITINLTNSFQFTKKLSLQSNIRYANQSGHFNSLGDFGSTSYGYRNGEYYMLPYAQFVDANGNYTKVPSHYRTGYTDTAGNGKLLDWSYNPLQESSLRDYKRKSQDLTLNGIFVYRITPDLQLTGSYQYRQANNSSQRHNPAATYFARNLVNLFTNLNSTNPNVRNPIPAGGVFNPSTIEDISHFGKAQINYNRVFNGKHQVSALAAGEVRSDRISTQSITYYGYEDARLTYASIDYVTRFPQYGNRGNAAISGAGIMTRKVNHFVSLLSNIGYTYDNRYVVTGSLRRDAANVFGIQTNRLWKPFWSIGAAWNVSKEKFFHPNWVSQLKLRATFGHQGNVNNSISPYTILEYQSTSGNDASLPYARILTPANPDLSWESSKQTNIALDFGFLKDRLSGTVEFYRKRSDNLLLGAEMDITTGVSLVTRNSATMATRGVDLSIESRNIQGKFSWQSQFTMAYVNTKVLKTMLAPPPITQPVVSASNFSPQPWEGYVPYAVYSYEFAGLDPANGDPLGYLGKNVSKDYQAILNQGIDTARLVNHGSSIPTYWGNLNNTFSYGGFTLTVSISYKLDYYFRKTSIHYYNLYRSGWQHPDYSKRWQKPGDEAHTAIPSMVYPLASPNRDQFYRYSSANVRKGDNIRLQYIQLRYDISNPGRKYPIQNIQVYATAENLGLLWRANDEGLDPDYNTGNSLFLPPMRITAGLKIDF